MAELPFSGQLLFSSNCRHHKKNLYITTLKIDAEWSLICIWSQCNPHKPEFLEIRRKSTAKDVLVSGTLKLMLVGRLCLFQRKFLQLIEAGSTTMQIEVEYSSNNSHQTYDYGFDPYSGGYNSNQFSITGTLKVSTNTTDKGGESAQGVQFKSLLDLSNNFECLLDPKSAYFSDVNVNCGTVSFSAHKNILSARSSVFAAMFSNQMKESRDNKVNITDLSPQVLKTMLTYIYSGKTGELSVQSAGELLFAADKYQLQDLKRVCSDYLKGCVSVKNVLKTLVLGYLHDKDLKVFAIDFICNSCEEFEILEKTAEWENLREKIPSLAMDVLTSLVKSRDQKLKSKK